MDVNNDALNEHVRKTILDSIRAMVRGGVTFTPTSLQIDNFPSNLQSNQTVDSMYQYFGFLYSNSHFPLRSLRSLRFKFEYENRNLYIGLAGAANG